jgi:hypothetical protein
MFGMKSLSIFVCFTVLFTACGGPEGAPTLNENKGNVILSDTIEANADSPSEIEVLAKDTASPSCIFTNPDTSLYNIVLRDRNSTYHALGHTTTLPSDETIRFYSKDRSQVMSMRIHPGDAINAVSIFQVYYPSNEPFDYPRVPERTFETGHGLKLGMRKKDILKVLGPCYSAKDSTAKGMTMAYKIEAPYDSDSRLLEREKMPVYYANYRIKSGVLVMMEFGFEYP